MGEGWQIKRKGKPVGVFSVHQVKELIQSGSLPEDSLIQKEGSSIWVKASSIPEIISAAEPANRPKAPPPPVKAVSREHFSFKWKQVRLSRIRFFYLPSLVIAWSGIAALAILSFLIADQYVNSQALQKHLAEANDDWNMGRKKEAVALYHDLIKTLPPSLHFITSCERIIEFELSNGDRDSAQKTAQVLLKSGAGESQSDTVRKFIAEIQQEPDDHGHSVTSDDGDSKSLSSAAPADVLAAETATRSNLSPEFPEADQARLNLADGRVPTVKVIERLKSLHGKRFSIVERFTDISGTEYEAIFTQLGGSGGYVGMIERTSKDENVVFVLAENDEQELVGVYLEVEYDLKLTSDVRYHPWFGLQDVIGDLFPDSNYVIRKIFRENSSQLALGEDVIRKIGSASVALHFSVRSRKLANIILLSPTIKEPKDSTSMPDERQQLLMSMRIAKAFKEIGEGEADLVVHRDEIEKDPRLTLARDMGELEATELYFYLQMKHRIGTDWEGFPANTCFLLLIPAKEWPNASRQLGVPREMYRLNVETVAKMLGVLPDNRVDVIEKLTGESLDSY